MTSYLCPSCHESVEGGGRFAWCPVCGRPLSSFDIAPVEPPPAPDGAVPSADAP